MSIDDRIEELAPGVYHCLTPIAQGGEGMVWRAESRVGESPVALKIFHRLAGRSYYQELALMNTVSHPHIIRVVDFREDGENRLLAYEYCAGGTLRRYLEQPFAKNFEDVLIIAEQITSALAYLQNVRLVHGDIKPENILLKRNIGFPQWKLSDFGLSRPVGAPRQNRGATPEYLGPEARSGLLTPQSDIYALGKVLHECLTIAEALTEANSSRPYEEFRQLVRALTSSDASRRPSARTAHACTLQLISDLRAARHSATANQSGRRHDCSSLHFLPSPIKPLSEDKS
jgi:serine/threonine protein kinase